MAAASEPTEQAQDLVVRLMQANHQNLVAVMNRQIENLEARVLAREAELAAIRFRINELFSTEFMPTSDAILQAVFAPSRKFMEEFREKYKRDEAS